MKNATRYCAGTAYYRMYSMRPFFFKTNRQRNSTKGNHHPSFLRFWNWAKKTVDAAKICGGTENVVKTKPANIRKWIARFITLGIYAPLEARVYCSQ